MLNQDLFEGYINLSLPKDLAFVSSVNLKKIYSDDNLVKKLKNYSVIKNRVDDFSSNIDFTSYYDNPLIEIQSELMDKDAELKKHFDAYIFDLKKGVESYQGNENRKFLDVEDSLSHLSLIHAFTGSNCNFEEIKNSIRSEINRKVNFSKPEYKIKKVFKKKRNNLLVGALAVGSFLAGSFLFPDQKEVRTTIDSSYYLSDSIPLTEKLNQFTIDRNEISKTEVALFKDFIDNYNNK